MAIKAQTHLLVPFLVASLVFATKTKSSYFSLILIIFHMKPTTLNTLYTA